MINSSRQPLPDFGSWAHHNPVQIVFGSGSLDRLPGVCAGEPVLVITTPGSTRRGITDQIVRMLDGRAVSVYDDVKPNPDVVTIESVVRAYLETPFETVFGIGGGSALDTAKAVGCLVRCARTDSNWEDALVSGRLRSGASVPVVAIPTTSGTGAEVTPFATIWDFRGHKKHSLAGPALFPRVAILDPSLTLSLPENETVASGLDALSQALESIWSLRATPISIACAQHAVQLAIRVLPEIIHDPGNLFLRSSMMTASLLSGLAISSTRTALAHSISYPLTAHYGVPHGLACSFTLPEICAYNAGVDDGRLLNLSRSLGFNSAYGLEYKLSEVLEALGVGARLKAYVGSVEEIVHLRDEMITQGRADNNMRGADREAIASILLRACERLQIPSMTSLSTQRAAADVR